MNVRPIAIHRAGRGKAGYPTFFEIEAAIAAADARNALPNMALNRGTDPAWLRPPPTGPYAPFAPGDCKPDSGRVSHDLMMSV